MKDQCGWCILPSSPALICPDFEYSSFIHWACTKIFIGRKDLVTYNQQSHSIIAFKVQGPGSWARNKQLPCWLSPAVFSSLTSLSPSGYSPRTLELKLTTNKPLYVYLPRLCLHCSVCVEYLYPAIHPRCDQIFPAPFKVQVTFPLNSSPTLWVELIAPCSRSTWHFIADLYYSIATQA